jgi:hypothetical protein
MRRLKLGVAMAAAIAVAAVLPAHADSVPEVKTCNGTGSLQVQPAANGTQTWNLSITGGFCDDAAPVNALQSMTATGTATSATLDPCGASVSVATVDFDVAVSFTDVVSGVTRTADETWTAAVSPAAPAAPFVIAGGGAGELYVQCQPTGPPAVQVQWAQTLS